MAVAEDRFGVSWAYAERARKLITEAKAAVQTLNLWHRVDRDLAKAFDQLVKAVELVMPSASLSEGERDE